MKLLIVNNVICHNEILESIIIKYHDILNINKDINLDINLAINNNVSYIKYISDKYPNIKYGMIDDYDYYINCTIYDCDYNKLNNNPSSNSKYISHEITDRLKTNPNVFFLTPLSIKNYIYADILPFSDKKIKTDIPVYIIQGNLNQNRRYLNLLTRILDNTYQYKFIIKLVGNGYLPRELIKFKDKIVLKNNLNFIDFHKEFLDVYCILPLISKITHPLYYNTKLTSTINYARGYKLKCLIDQNLQDIYNLNDVEVYNNISDIQIGFEKTLLDFYR
jgi:hypothetical protein